MLTWLQIAFYFAFLQTYFYFLIYLAIFGFSCWVLLGYFSPVYAVVNGLWCALFVEWWKRQEVELAIRWGVRNVDSIQRGRREFEYEKTIDDPVTGETVRWFPTRKRLQRQLLQVPFALIAAAGLGTIICTCFATEIFISEVYSGPLKTVLVFIPTLMLTTLVPTMTNFLLGFATRLNRFENHETQDAYEKAMTSKVFVLNFITSYMAIFLTAFVYIPFAPALVPYLDVLGLTVKPFAENEKQMEAPPAYEFNINPYRLRKQVIYFTVTAQVVSFAMETIVPKLKRLGTQKFKQMQSSRAEGKDEKSASSSSSSPSSQQPANHAPIDLPEEKDFLARVRHEATLQDYDVTVDLREMCVQFGYLSLFSVVWPLVPCSFLVNNWVELRGDTYKITRESKRPVPERAAGIGPWLNALSFLAWLGSITAAAIVYMFRSDADVGSGTGSANSYPAQKITLWALLLCVLASEHIHLLVRWAARTALSKLDSDNLRKERAERYHVRRRYLEERGLGADEQHAGSRSLRTKDGRGGAGGGLVDPSSITKTTLEDEARQASLSESNPTTRFWGRQRGWAEVEKVGVGLIERQMEESQARQQKKDN